MTGNGINSLKCCRENHAGMHDTRAIPLHESCIPKKDSSLKIDHKISLSAIWQTTEKQPPLGNQKNCFS